MTSGRHVHGYAHPLESNAAEKQGGFAGISSAPPFGALVSACRRIEYIHGPVQKADGIYSVDFSSPTGLSRLPRVRGHLFLTVCGSAPPRTSYAATAHSFQAAAW